MTLNELISELPGIYRPRIQDALHRYRHLELKDLPEDFIDRLKYVNGIGRKSYQIIVSKMLECDAIKSSRSLKHMHVLLGTYWPVPGDLIKDFHEFRVKTGLGITESVDTLVRYALNHYKKD